MKKSVITTDPWVSNEQFILKVGKVQTYARDKFWVECCMSPNGTIYIPGGKKIINKGKKLVLLKDSILAKIPTAGSGIWRPGYFFRLGRIAEYISPGKWKVPVWRSEDNLKTVRTEEAIFNIPRASKKPSASFHMPCLNDLVEMPDGRYLMAMWGNFKSDKVHPYDWRSKDELKKYTLQRNWLVASSDKGKTWKYVSTIAEVKPDNPVGEGFDESSMVLLNDGRLFCVMRTGHTSPFFCSWSSDQGKTWTEPSYMGIPRGCLPRLLKLKDGRLVLSYGVRHTIGEGVGAPGARPKPDWTWGRIMYLALNPDGKGRWWHPAAVGWKKDCRCSGYTTIFEVEPNIIFYFVDNWFWRIMLMPKVPDRF